MATTKLKVSVRGNVTRVKAETGFAAGVELLCKLKDTENGFIVKFPSYSAVTQDNYVCLDYDEAEYLYHALKPHIEKWKKAEA
jgi:hypothetical protein